MTFSLFYLYGGKAPGSAWHGGSVVWGPRYHLPLLPLLLLPYASALSIRSVVAKIWVVVWSLAGLILQLAVGTTSWSDAVLQMVRAYAKEVLIGLDGIPWYSWKLLPRSPALVQLLNWQPRQLDLIWLRALVGGTLARDNYLALLLLTLTGLVFLALMLMVAMRREAIQYARVIAVSCVLLVIAGSAGLLLRSGRDTNDQYGLTCADARQMAQMVNSSGQMPYTVVFVSNDFFSNYWLGLLKGQFVTQWYSPYDKVGPATILTQAPSARIIWLVVDRTHMPPDINPYLARQMLAQQAYEVSGQWVGDFELFEYILPEPMEHEAVRRSWTTGINLTGIAIDTRQIHPGEALRLDMAFSTMQPLAQNYTLFVHLVPVEGRVIAGRDGEPQYGGAPTSTWKPKQTVTLERRGIRVPLDAKPGVYQIVCGWLDPDGIRLMPTVGEGPTVDGGSCWAQSRCWLTRHGTTRALSSQTVAGLRGGFWAIADFSPYFDRQHSGTISWSICFRDDNSPAWAASPRRATFACNWAESSGLAESPF